MLRERIKKIVDEKQEIITIALVGLTGRHFDSMKNLTFQQYYNQTIYPELNRMEQKRVRLYRLLAGSILLGVGVVAFGLWLNVLAISLTLVALLSFYLVWLIYRFRKFKREFKPKVVSLILDFIDDGINYGTLQYFPDRKIPIKEFHNSNIFGANPAVYEGEDYIKGRIGEIPFELCELNVREQSPVRNRLNYVFQGIFLKATINRSFKGTVLVLPRAFRQYLMRSIKDYSLKGGRPMDMAIRNKHFREVFMTFSNFKTRIPEALTEDIQRSVLAYYEATGKEIYLSFKNNTIYLAITDHHDILEPSYFHSNVSFELVREFYNDLELIFHIVMDFDRSH